MILNDLDKNLCVGAFTQMALKVCCLRIQTEQGGEAVGDVQIKKEQSGVWIFEESGIWLKRGGQGMRFHNRLRWSCFHDKQSLQLEHLRYGLHRPILLAHLVPVSSGGFESAEPHICQSDCYVGRIEWSEEGMELSWKINGVHKNETLRFFYSCYTDRD